MLNRIDTTLATLQQSNRQLLSPYITAGDPTLADTLTLMHALVRGGADVLEIGLPFSDPMAEGLVIQAAMERALQQGVTTDAVLDLIAEFRKQDHATPIILMGYLNPIEIYGYEHFAKKAQQCGVDGTILVDMPPEESGAVMALWQKYGLYNIYLCSPTTTTKRMALINQYAKGYLYFVSLKGVTGSDDFNLSAVKAIYRQRQQETTLPLMVGFGIKSAEMAAAIAEFADGVIVGAALINRIEQAYREQGNLAETAQTFMGSLRQAMNHSQKVQNHKVQKIS